MKRLLAVVVTSALLLSAGAAFAQGAGPRHDPRAVQTALGDQSWGGGYDREMMYEAYGWDGPYGWDGSYEGNGPYGWDGPSEWDGSYGWDGPDGWDRSNYGWGCGGW